MKLHLGKTSLRGIMWSEIYSIYVLQIHNKIYVFQRIFMNNQWTKSLNKKKQAYMLYKVTHCAGCVCMALIYWNIVNVIGIR